MTQFYIIPDEKNINDSIEISSKYNTCFEYNDFYFPDILDNSIELRRIINFYKSLGFMPKGNTMHGAFFDVLIFSADERIRKISEYRIDQSIEIANELDAKAVIFHTNYMPTFYNESYRKSWVEINALFWSEKCLKHPEINILIENMFDITPELLSKLAENLKNIKNCGVCFDYAHASLSDVSPEEWAKSLSRFTKHIHINDNDLNSDLHQPVGDGKINWGNYKKIYKEFFSDCSVLIETTGKERILKSFDYIEKANIMNIIT